MTANDDGETTATSAERWRLEALYRKVTAESDNELTGLPFQTVLDRIARRVDDELPTSLGASVILWDDAAQSFTIASTTVPGQSNETPVRRVRREGGASRWVVDYQEPMIVEDTKDDPFGANQMIGDFKVAAYAAVPIAIQGEPVGVLYALDARPRKYSEAEILFLERLARRAAIEINTARQLGQAAAVEGRHSALMNVTKALIEAESPNETLQAIVDAVAESLPADRVLVITLDESARVIEDQIVGGPGAAHVGVSTYTELMAGLTGWALRTQQTVVSPKGEEDSRESSAARQERRSNGSGSLVVIPLRFVGESMGTMTVINRTDQPDFTSSDVRLAESMASQAATAIAQTRLAASIHDHDATRDPRALTRRLVDALATRDGASLVGLLAETAIVEITGRSFLAGQHMGRRAVLRTLQAMSDASDRTYSATVTETYVSPEGAVAILQTTGRRNGRDLEAMVHLRLRILNGRVVRATLIPEDIYAFDEAWGETL